MGPQGLGLGVALAELRMGDFVPDGTSCASEMRVSEAWFVSEAQLSSCALDLDPEPRAVPAWHSLAGSARR